MFVTMLQESKEILFLEISMPIPAPFIEEEIPPFLWNRPGVVAILSDLHIPYHDEKAIAAAVDYISSYIRRKKKKLTLLIINGDGIDCYELSDYEKKSGRPNYDEECKKMREFLKHLKKRFPKTKIIYKKGNHEKRVERYLINKASALSLEANSIQEMVGTRDLGVEVLGDQQIIWLGNQAVVHGHEFSESRCSSVNPAKSLYDKSGEEAIGGHHHRTSSFIKKTISGYLLRCYTMGCLAHLSPEYRRHNQYNHGFAITEILENGVDFHCDNLIIENGVVL